MLNDRGIFWWSDTPIPDNQFAPDEAVAGLLTISDTGQISIELDQVTGPFAPLHHPFPPVSPGLCRGAMSW